MDISKLTHGAKLVLGATIAVPDRLDLQLAGGRIPSSAPYGVSMWHGWGVLAGLIAIAIIVWEGLRLANMKIEIGLTPAMVTAALAILLVVFTVLKFLVSNEFRTFWAWLGLLLAILVAVGAWVNMKQLGESVAEMGSVDEDRGRAAPPRRRRPRPTRAPTTPAAPAPAAPEPPAAPEAPAAPQPPRPRSPRRCRAAASRRAQPPATSRRRPPPDRRGVPAPAPAGAGTPPGHPATLDRMSENGHKAETGTMRVKSGLAEMLKGGVIMDVVNAEQAVIAENAGACAVMALERVPADIRRDGGVARMSDPGMIREIQEAVSIPVMAKCRIGHFAEAQILQALEIDYIDESEVLTPADIEHHVDKWGFTIPFVCGATNLGEALRRIGEGAAMIRTKGEAGTGDVVNAVTHMRAVFGGIRRLQSLRSDELYTEAKNLQAPYELVRWVAENGRLPVVTFTAGGIATPADASLCMQLGADGVFVGSGIFKSGDPDLRAKAIVEATTHFQDAKILAEVSTGLGEPMVGISSASLADSERLEVRGW